MNLNYPNLPAFPAEDSAHSDALSLALVHPVAMFDQFVMHGALTNYSQWWPQLTPVCLPESVRSCSPPPLSPECRRRQ